MTTQPENTSVLAFDLQAEVSKFIEAYQRGMSAWEEAGRIIVAIVDNDPHAVDDIVKLCPALTPSIIHVFERIGRGLLLPALAMDTSAGAAKLRELPLSAQKRYETEPVPLVIETEHGTDILLVDVKNLTRDQARQVFAKGRIRSDGEQKAYLVEQQSLARRTAKTSEIPAWRIVKGRVVFEKGATLSAGELATIITQITK
jgi:hypothetical protein